MIGHIKINVTHTDNTMWLQGSQKHLFISTRNAFYGMWYITWPLGLLRHSRSSNVTEFGTNRKLICDLLLVINSNLAPILHRFRDIAFDRSKIAIFGYPSCLTPPTEGFPWDDLRKILPGCQWVAKVPNGVETLRKISIAWVGRTNVTDRRTDDDAKMNKNFWLYWPVANS